MIPSYPPTPQKPAASSPPPSARPNWSAAASCRARRCSPLTSPIRNETLGLRFKYHIRARRKDKFKTRRAQDGDPQTLISQISWWELCPEQKLERRIALILYLWSKEGIFFPPSLLLAWLGFREKGFGNRGGERKSRACGVEVGFFMRGRRGRILWRTSGVYWSFRVWGWSCGLVTACQSLEINNRQVDRWE